MKAPRTFSALPPAYLCEASPKSYFEGEPAISEFDWNFTAIHKSSQPFQRTWVRSSMTCYSYFNLLMDRSPGFGSTACNFSPLFRLGFPAAPVLYTLTSLPYHNSLARSTKGTRSLPLPLLVGIGFQVLFHSPPGVLFTFPSRYSSLSVTG